MVSQKVCWKSNKGAKNVKITELVQQPLFRGLTEQELEAALKELQATSRNYPAGSILLNVGDRPEWLGVLLSGRAEIGQEDFWGNRNLMAVLEPGDVFAESFACARVPSGVVVTAREETQVLQINVNRLLASDQKQMIGNLVAALAGKNLRFHSKLTHMGQRTTREKLRSFLSAEAQRQGSSEFDIPYNRQQLADYLSVERSALSAELGRMQREGILETHRQHFHLLTQEVKVHKNR